MPFICCSEARFIASLISSLVVLRCATILRSIPCATALYSPADGAPAAALTTGTIADAFGVDVVVERRPEGLAFHRRAGADAP